MRTKQEYQEKLNDWYAIYLIDLEEKEIARDGYFALQELIDNLPEDGAYE